MGNTMNSTKTSLGYSLLAIVLAGTVAIAAPPVSQPSAAAKDVQFTSQAALPKPGTGNFAQSVVRKLRGNGLEVSVGYPMLYTQKDCTYSYAVFKNCFGNNPASPYIAPIVEFWPDEYVDPAMTNGFGRTRPGYGLSHRIDPREAILIFGKMPPKARYLGLQTWMWTTGWVSSSSPWNEIAYGDFEPVAQELIQYLFATVPGNTDRVQSFSSIDNNINNVVMEKQSGPPWDEMRYLVITPDQLTDVAVRETLEGLGVDEDEIFTERIPASFEDAAHDYPYGQSPGVGPLGLDRDAADFVTFIRYAMPENEKAADVWRMSLPLTVLRVRRPSSGPAPEPYGARAPDVRTAVDEVGDAVLGSEFSSLIDAVIARAQSQGLKLDSNLPMIDILNELGSFGPACRAIGMNCLGDNQDASYFLLKPQPLDGGQIYAVVSTLATETGNGTYVGLSVNDASLLKGVLNVSDKELKGSARAYGVSDKLFVHFFTRDCAAITGLTDGACSTITLDMVPLAGDEKAPGDAALHGKFSTAVRAYVQPGSERGADPTKQLRPQVLVFSYD